MKDAVVTSEGARIRWVELPGSEPARVYVHGLGASAPVYFSALTHEPVLRGRRSLLVDLLGFGISDRPAAFGYSLTEHAGALAAALDAAGVTGAEVVGHSMGGAVSIVLAERRPDLVSRLILAEANLDPRPHGSKPTGSGIFAYSRDAFVKGGFAETLERVGPFWAATMRLADPVALHATAVSLAEGTRPIMRDILVNLPMPRTFLIGERSEELAGRESLVAAGVDVVTIPDAGHNIMIDNPTAFAEAIA